MDMSIDSDVGEQNVTTKLALAFGPQAESDVAIQGTRVYALPSCT